MSGLPRVAITAIVTVTLALVARERATAYGLDLRLPAWRALALLASAPLVRYALPCGPTNWSSSVALAAAAVSAVTDLQTGYVFDRVLLVAAPLAALAAWADGRVENALVACAACGGAFLALFVLSRGGIGLGDVKLATLLAACLGLPETMCAIAVAFGSGASYGLWLLIRGAHRKCEVPFAGFLALGTAVAFVESPH